MLFSILAPPPDVHTAVDILVPTNPSIPPVLDYVLLINSTQL